MGRTVTMIFIGVIEAIASAKEQTTKAKDPCEGNQYYFEVNWGFHRIINVYFVSDFDGG